MRARRVGGTLFGGRGACTGIDLGSASIKIVRGVRTSSRVRVTHAGLVELSESAGESASGSSEALGTVLDRLKLRKTDLGRVAVGVRGDGVSVREVLLPAMRPDEIEKAVPFEAKRHLFLDGMESPLFSHQILGNSVPGVEGESPQIRVLLAAVAKSKRDDVLQLLSRVGLEPEIIDVDALANVNALVAASVTGSGGSSSIGVLDLGKSNAELCLTDAEGGVLMRVVGPGAPQPGKANGSDSYPLQLARSVKETVTYYRGRQRKEVRSISLSGGGALIRELPDVLSKHLGTTVSVLNPLMHSRSSITSGRSLVDASGPRFATAYGLCHRFVKP